MKGPLSLKGVHAALRGYARNMGCMRGPGCPVGSGGCGEAAQGRRCSHWRASPPPTQSGAPSQLSPQVETAFHPRPTVQLSVQLISGVSPSQSYQSSSHMSFEIESGENPGRNRVRTHTHTHVHTHRSEQMFAGFASSCRSARTSGVAVQPLGSEGGDSDTSRRSPSFESARAEQQPLGRAPGQSQAWSDMQPRHTQDGLEPEEVG